MPMEDFIIFISSFAFPFQASRSSVAASSCDSLHLHQGSYRAGSGLRRGSPVSTVPYGSRCQDSIFLDCHHEGLSAILQSM